MSPLYRRTFVSDKNIYYFQFVHFTIIYHVPITITTGITIVYKGIANGKPLLLRLMRFFLVMMPTRTSLSSPDEQTTNVDQFEIDLWDASISTDSWSKTYHFEVNLLYK